VGRAQASLSPMFFGLGGFLELIMAKDFTQGFYTSPAWLKCRASFIATRIATDGGLCQMCKYSLGYIVHHIKPVTPDSINDYTVTLNHGNLMFLCSNCHNKIHGDVRCVVTADGEVYSPPIRKLKRIRSEPEALHRKNTQDICKEGGIMLRKAELLDKIPEEVRSKVKVMIDDVDFMNKRIAALKKTIITEGEVELFSQGKQRFLRQSPAMTTYLALVKQRDMTMDKIKGFMPKQTAEVKDDEFEEFVAAR